MTGYQPTKGPAAGGTKITELGSDLDSGSNVSVTLAGISCTVEKRYVSDFLRRYYFGCHLCRV